MPMAEMQRAETALPLARVFVGLKIGAQIASQLAELAAPLKEASVRPVAPADIHLTLVPPWNEVSVADTIAKLAGVAAKCGRFVLRFQRVGYGPQPRQPRLLWAECVATREISALHTVLLQTFGQTADDRPFLPHVTLARLRADPSAIVHRHPIDQPLTLTQQVETIELFQSPPTGVSGYRVLASVRLAETARSQDGRDSLHGS
jgi:RNA 2',3'-cyclic 3'-phosphodiesterase